MAVEYLAEKQRISLTPSLQSYQGIGTIGGLPVRVILPQTWMNQTGVVVGELLRQSDIQINELVLVYDDLDLSFGTLRFKTRGGAGGHNGVRSILSILNTEELCRLKIGIGRPPLGTDVVEYVLEPFSSSELLRLGKIFERATEALESLVRDGVKQAMNEFNSRQIPEESV